MPLQHYKAFQRPNKWLEPRYARPYYDIFDKRTGQKKRVAAADLWNAPHKLQSLFGKDSNLIVRELQRREKEIETLKQSYLDLYEAVKERYDAGMKIPSSWITELEEMFDQMYQKDTDLGNFSKDEDTLEALNENEKIRTMVPSNVTSKFKYTPTPVVRNPETEAPHRENMPNINSQTVDDDNYYQGMNMKMSNTALKCGMLMLLEKDEALSAGPTEARAVGYVSPTTDEKAFGEPASTITEGYRNPLYSKKKKKVKQFMKAVGFVGNLENMTNQNDNFREVIYTGKHSQLVLMKLLPGEEIGEEVHEDIDQFFRVDSGEGVVVIDGKNYKLVDGSGIIVPAGAKHNVINDSKSDLKLYTIYSPPEHKDGVVRATKQEAETQKEEFDGKTSEQS